MKRLFTFACLLTLTAVATAQPKAAVSPAGAYQIPFDTDGNRIELTVENSTAVAYEELEVVSTNTPAWLAVESPAFGIDALGVKHDALASFTFSVDDSAPTETIETLTFEVYAGEELVAKKDIDISVELPKELFLRGNYPNPFNPSTTIGFVLPADGEAELQIIDAVGRLVDTLSKPDALRGQQTFRWNANRFASGVYLYRLQFQSESGLKEVRLGKMLLIK